jgi:hypothetical protein
VGRGRRARDRSTRIASLADEPAIDDATVILVGLRRDPRLE